MTEKSRDPLAEHPLGGEPAAPAKPRGRTLSLFPDVSETPLSPPAGTAERSGAVADTQTPPSAEEIDEPGELFEETASGMPVAFARRFAAGLADIVILGLFGALELASGALLLELRFPPAALLGLGAFLFLAALVLMVLVPFVWGATPGMALADLRVAAEDGGSPTLAAASLRFLGALLTAALAGVPLLVAAFDRKGRTLSDLLSGTTLVPAR
ncbi:MAG: RDD family protein [Thermoanaerobaculia bacterium]|nr:RDD family protein [Thermoanaerobaculia bacterium]